MLGFKLSKFGKSDFVALIFLFVALLTSSFLNKKVHPQNLIAFIISFLIFYMTISSPIGIRFKNFYFSIVWLTLCLIFLLVNSSHTLLSTLPLLSFCYFQIVRMIYWLKFRREFIPLWVTSTISLRFSKLENRTATNLDAAFMLVLFIFGLISLPICFYIFRN